jgi:hemerythrin
MYFEWENSFSVGVNSIDAEHKKIIEFINNLHDAANTGKSIAVMSGILGGLVEYTMTHFANEEALMKKHGYPNLEKHRELHDDLFVKVNEYRARLKTERDGFADELMAFLKEWLIQHILKTDMAYKEFFRSHGVS